MAENGVFYIIAVVGGIGALLLFILLPMSFSGVEYYEVSDDYDVHLCSVVTPCCCRMLNALSRVVSFGGCCQLGLLCACVCVCARACVCVKSSQVKSSKLYYLV